ncbi:hypothetical protein BGZ82_011815 [Podila clonocystis]|nr:hypothetical protein BGZ82_011815 [Podila clonocystis]
MTPDAPQPAAAVADQENNLETDLGRVMVLFAPVRRITRSMTHAAENAAQPEPEPVGVANRPKRVIRRVVLDYDDIIHHVPAAIRTSRL